MQFRESQPIYLQIADYVCEKILLHEWKAEERILSVRELAINLEVNPNTVMRTYEFLSLKGIIYNERGIGFYISNRARRNALDYRKDEFVEKDLPNFFRNLFLLEMGLDELRAPFEKYIKRNFPNVA